MARSLQGPSAIPCPIDGDSLVAVDRLSERVLMAKRRWKPKEIRSVLLTLGFVEKSSRGKGDHRMYFKTIDVPGKRAITLIAMLDMGSDVVSAKSLKRILRSIRLDKNTLEHAYRRQYHRRDYEEYLQKIL